MQTAVALLLAPLCAAVIEMVVGWAFYMTHGDKLGLDDLTMPFFAASALLLGVAFFFVLPFYAVSSWRRWNSPLAYGFFGALLGAVLETVVFQAGRWHLGTMPSGVQLSHYVDGLMWFGGPIALTVWVFWLIRRPDRDTPAA